MSLRDEFGDCLPLRIVEVVVRKVKRRDFSSRIHSLSDFDSSFFDFKRENSQFSVVAVNLIITFKFKKNWMKITLKVSVSTMKLGGLEETEQGRAHSNVLHCSLSLKSCSWPQRISETWLFILSMQLKNY